MNRFGGWLNLLVLAVALILGMMTLGVFGYVTGSRIGYPYDLEWMESGMLCHALRLYEGKSIYVPPSVEFIPHLYTPLYPGLLAAVWKLTGGPGGGYLSARLLSVLSFGLALLSGVILAARAAIPVGSLRRGLLPASLCMLIPLGAAPQVGGFYDLARCDSLQLGLTTLGLCLCYCYRERHGWMALAALVLVASFFAKQTAAPMIAACGAAVVCEFLWKRRPKAVFTFGVVGVVSFGVGVWLLNWATAGWFWTYIFKLHQSHAFFARRAYVETPRVLVGLVGPVLLLVPITLSLVRGERGLLFVSWLGLCGFGSACLSFGTQWAHVNAYIPGVFFPSVAAGAAAARLCAWPTGRRRYLEGVAYGLCALSLGYLLRFHQVGSPPGEHIPSAEDRSLGDALIATMRKEAGEVLVPFHPFYGYLAGKKTYVHRMGVWDVRGTPAGPVRGLSEALAEKRFSLIVFDQKVEGTFHDWPGVLESYGIDRRIRGPRVVEGARTEPALLMRPLPRFDEELQ